MVGAKPLRPAAIPQHQQYCSHLCRRLHECPSCSLWPAVVWHPDVLRVPRRTGRSLNSFWQSATNPVFAEDSPVQPVQAGSEAMKSRQGQAVPTVIFVGLLGSGTKTFGPVTARW